MASAYETLLSRIREIGQLESVEALLDWDQETFMPEQGINARAEQLALLAKLVHQWRTSTEMGELLGRLNGDLSSDVERANVRETRRHFFRASKLPSSLVERIARVSVLSKAAWAKARSESDFSAFAPHLKELLELKREVADKIGFKQERYDALLDEFEPGAETSEVAAVFASLRGPLSAFVKELCTSTTKPDVSIVHRHFPQDGQTHFSRVFAERIGFDFDRGRLDVSTHPFCSGHTPYDVRLTTRYYEDFFPSAIFGTLHEAGHGVYEQGLDTNHAFTPMGAAISLGIHESQSRLWENIIGRSRSFWSNFYTDFQKTFSEALGDVSLDTFVGAINSVQPSLIRVEADEVTYNLHIILRFEIERELVSGSLDVNDLPAAWNAKMGDLIGIEPEKDADGCLQDIHWSMGIFGYFPTYCLGNLYSVQFYNTAKKEIPDLEHRIAKGDFATLLEWLRENIYRHGQRYRAAELLQNVTGETLSAEPFMNYLRGKFSPIYGL